MRQETFKEGSEFPPCEPGKLRLYSMRFCPYAQRARLVANFKNLQYEIVNIELRSKPEWFVSEVNPDGTVPVLLWDNQVISESLVLASYLDETYMEPYRLTSSDPLQRAKDQVVITRCAKVSGIMFSNYPVLLDGDENKREDIYKTLGWLETKVAKRGTPFLAGDKLGMVDLMIWPWFEQTYFLCPLTEERFPNLTAWMSLMKKDPTIEKTAVETDILQQFFLTCKAGKMNCDIESMLSVLHYTSRSIDPTL